jgi:hypothetical protein
LPVLLPLNKTENVVLPDEIVLHRRRTCPAACVAFNIQRGFDDRKIF